LALPCQGDKGWAREHFVNARTMKTVEDTRKQLADLCARHDIPLESAGHDTDPVRRALVAGFYMNLAVLRPDGSYLPLYVVYGPDTRFLILDPEIDRCRSIFFC
jgi:hypothetical protein